MWASRARPTTAGRRKLSSRERVQRVTRIVGIACVGAMITALITAFISPATAKANAPESARVKAYYLALGDSLAFGYQPNGDFNDGYAQQWFAMLQSQGSRSLTDYGCPGSTTQNFVEQLGCSSAHDHYSQSQLNAAVSFIEAHRYQVSPVSLDIGANDLVNAISAAITYGPTPPQCTVNAAIADPIIQQAVKNIDEEILPDLVQALTGPGGQRTGDLVLMNLFDPLQNACPATVPYVEQFNQGLAAAAAQFQVPVIDVFTAFGGEGVGSPYLYYNPLICEDTWFTVPLCPQQSAYPTDIHPTTEGYGVIARAYNRLVGDE